MKTTLFISLLFVCLFGAVSQSIAQGEQKSLTFSGIVIEKDSDEPLAGAYVINTRAGKGSLTNSRGYFIVDAFPGDSLVFSFMGFKPQYLIVRSDWGATYSAVVELSIDAKMLREVKVYPYRTEEEFKEAFLSMAMPNAEERRIIEKNLGGNAIRALAMAAPMSGMGNYRYAMEQQLNHAQNQRLTTLNPLFNVGSWANFIKTVKDGSFVKGLKTETNQALPIDKGSRDDFFKQRN